MWKKVVPTVALCSFLLVGCNNVEKTVPNNNETPMEDVRNDVNTPSPNHNNGMNDNGNGTLNDETIRDETIRDETIRDDTNINGTMNNGTVEENVPNDGKVIKEPNTKNDDDHIINDKDNNIK